MTLEHLSGSEALDSFERRDASVVGPLAVHDGVLEVIGSTPRVRLRRLPGAGPLEACAKLESLDPGGSSEDRPALAIIEQALRDERIGPDTMVIESTPVVVQAGAGRALRPPGRSRLRARLPAADA